MSNAISLSLIAIFSASVTSANPSSAGLGGSAVQQTTNLQLMAAGSGKLVQNSANVGKEDKSIVIAVLTKILAEEVQTKSR